MGDEAVDVLGWDFDAGHPPEVADPDGAESQRAHGQFGLVDPVEEFGCDPDAVSDPRGEAGQRGLIGNLQAERTRQGSNLLLAGALFHERVSDAELFGRPEARA
jgi:hypothetical protein